MSDIFSTKKVSETQNYENYWKLTLEYSDIQGAPFINVLNTIVQFIDSHPNLKEEYSSEDYQSLTKMINNIYPKRDQASTRKSINQFVKLGFIYPKLSGYPKETKRFLFADSERKRELLFSEVYYKYSSFNSSVTNDNRNNKHVNFLLKTLMYHPKQSLNKDELIALMTTEISVYNKGYLVCDELDTAVKHSKAINFAERKYNQISYFMNYLSFIPGITVTKDKSSIYYTEDSTIDFKSDLKLTRDPTMFRIMKENIKQECIEKYGNIICYFTKRPQKGIVVSHIWALQDALDDNDINAAYDYNNALLLEPNVDAYFDKYDMTFESTGIPIFNDTVIYDEFIDNHKNYRIDRDILNESRISYLLKHNKKYQEKTFKIPSQ